MSSPHPASTANWHLFVPKLVTVLRQGYSFEALRGDTLAGITVAIVALPLAMAIAIASGTTPDKGLFTAIVAGFLISALGGSRFQIGGPTGAFIVVVFDVIQDHGYDGLLIATFMAGLILIAAGLARLGNAIKFIPHTVVTGFTAGIALIIFSSQVSEILGLRMESAPAEFLEKWAAIGAHIGTVDPATAGIGALTLATILLLRRYRPSLPAFLIGVAVGSLAAYGLGLPVATIGSRFGGIPTSLPQPAMPDFSAARFAELVPSALTIAFLAGIESLLSAMVADGMTGRRHRSNCELVAQGIANCASVLVGGLPATGAIARTATNIRSGARSPVAGMLHAVFLLLFMVVLAPLAAFLPLASLGAVLVVVAWNMSEQERFRRFLSAPMGDRLVLLITFGTTVLVDLTVGITVGVVLAALVFMRRMSETVEMATGTKLIEEDIDDFAGPAAEAYRPRHGLPDGIEVIQVRGPLFFGVVDKLETVLDRIREPPRAIILRLRQMPLMDAAGLHAFEGLLDQCRKRGIELILSGVQPQPLGVLTRMGLGPETGRLTYAPDFAAAVAEAKRSLDEPGAACEGRLMPKSG